MNIPEQESNQFESFEINHKKLQYDLSNKILATVMMQLFITSVLNIIAYNSSFLSSIIRHLSILWMLGTVISSGILYFSRSLSKKVPINYALLLIFTVSESFALHNIIMNISPEIILTALFITTISICFLYYVAKNVEFNFTSFKFMTSFLIGHMLMNLVSLFFFGFNTIYIYISTLSFCVYIVVDLQLIIGDKEKKFTTDDYIHASILLYSDIIILFIKIVQMLEKISNDKKEKDKKKKK